MPTPAHTRITWSGVFGSVAEPLETWQFGVNVGPVAFASADAREDAAQACHVAWVDHLAPRVRAQVSLTNVRVAQVLETGLVSKNGDGQYNQADDPRTAPGSGGVIALPFQVALCISLVTARSGPEGKGRFYLPGPNVQLETDGRISAAAATSHATSAAAFLGAVDLAIAGSGGASGNPVVASSKGFLSPVTGVRVGRVLDTQRRRRGDLAEGYSAVVALP